MDGEEFETPGDNLSGDPGGQGGDGEHIDNAPDYGGYQTPEELVGAHQDLTSERDALQEQLRNLESLKGRQGQELGTLRQKVATMTGQLQAMDSMMQQNPQPRPQQGPTIDTIAQQLRNGEIDEAQAISLSHQLATHEAETRLGMQFQEKLQHEIGTLKNEIQFEKYVSNFLKDNPGYEEAYNQGKLSRWMSQGMSGEQAWDKYRLDATTAELDRLKSQSEKEAKRAEQSGVNKGIKIEKGKTAAGRVLTGKGGQFSKPDGGYDLNDPSQRRQAGIERLKQIRGG